MNGPATEAPEAAPEDVTFRLLEALEAPRLVAAVRAVYGETYAVRWAYDAQEIAWRISEGHLFSVIGETGDGELLCHGAITLRSPHDVVGHAGQAITMPAARGRHMYTALKRYQVARARTRGLVGMTARPRRTTPTANGSTSTSARTRPGSSSGSSRARSTTA